MFLMLNAVETPTHDQMRYYLQRNKLLQNGFRANHLTDIYLSKLTEMIFSGGENGKNTDKSVTDLQKASDT